MRLTIILFCTLLMSSVQSPLVAYSAPLVDTNENDALQPPADLSEFFQTADQFFRTYVSSGLVKYDAIAKNASDLTQLVDMISAVDLSTSEKNTQTAFYINAYNILTIQNIVSNWPLKSPLDKKGFFDAKRFQVAGESMTLNDLEGKKLRPDPRVHFVLVCGAKGCPTIMNSAYMPDKVQAQLDMQTKKALDNANFIRIDESSKKVLISEIFNWYADDFKKTNGSVEKYINANRSNPLPTGYSIGYYTYDWNVNAVK